MSYTNTCGYSLIYLSSKDYELVSVKDSESLNKWNNFFLQIDEWVPRVVLVVVVAFFLFCGGNDSKSISALRDEFVRTQVRWLSIRFFSPNLKKIAINLALQLAIMWFYLVLFAISTIDRMKIPHCNQIRKQIEIFWFLLKLIRSSISSCILNLLWLNQRIQLGMRWICVFAWAIKIILLNRN